MRPARDFLERLADGLKWQHAGLLVAFCALESLSFAVDPATGGAPRTLAAYVTGFAAALGLFFPPYVLVSATAGFAT